MSELKQSVIDLCWHRSLALPENFEEARQRLAALVAKWQIPTYGAHKHRATDREMAERAVVTRWLITTADRRLSRRGVAYRASALLGLPKTEKAFDLIENMTLSLRDSGLVDWDLIRDGRRTALFTNQNRTGIPHTLRSSRANHWLDLWEGAIVQGQ